MMNSSTQLTSKMVDVIFNKPLQVTVEDNMLVIVQPSGGVATANLNWFNKKQLNTLISVLEDIADNMES